MLPSIKHTMAILPAEHRISAGLAVQWAHLAAQTTLLYDTAIVGETQQDLAKPVKTTSIHSLRGGQPSRVLLWALLAIQRPFQVKTSKSRFFDASGSKLLYESNVRLQMFPWMTSIKRLY